MLKIIKIIKSKRAIEPQRKEKRARDECTSASKEIDIIALVGLVIMSSQKKREKSYRCEIRDHFGFWSFWVRYVRKRDSREDYENHFRTNGIIVLLGAFEDLHGKGIPPWTTETKVLDCSTARARASLSANSRTDEKRGVTRRTARSLSVCPSWENSLVARSRGFITRPCHIIEGDEFRECHSRSYHCTVESDGGIGTYRYGIDILFTLCQN